MARVDVARRIIKAPALRIYQAFAELGSITCWLPPSGMSGEMLDFDFREGGYYRMRLTYNEPQHTPGKSSENSDEVFVRITGLAPGKRIAQQVTFESDDPSFAGEMKMFWTFVPAKEGTLVEVRCEDVPEGIRADDHQAGLDSTLKNLAAFAEAGYITSVRKWLS